MQLTHRIKCMVLLAILAQGCNEPQSLFDRGVRKLGYEPVCQASTLTVGAIVSSRYGTAGESNLVCSGRRARQAQEGGAYEAIESGWTHRLIFSDLCAEEIDDAEEIEMARQRSAECLRMVRLRQEAGHTVGIVRAVLRGRVADNADTYRLHGVLGARIDPLFWSLDPLAQESRS